MDKTTLALIILSCAALSRADDSLPPTWAAKSGTGKTVCILASFNADVTVRYPRNNATDSVVTFPVPVMKVGVDQVNSKCPPAGKAPVVQNIVLDWSTFEHTIQFDFQKVASTNVQLSALRFSYDLADKSLFPGANLTNSRMTAATLQSNVDAFPVQNHFQCMSGVSVQLQPNVNITFTNVRLEAFQVGNSTDFNNATTTCAADFTSTTSTTQSSTTTSESTTTMSTTTPTTTTNQTTVITTTTTEVPTTTTEVPTTTTEIPTTVPTTMVPTTQSPPTTVWSVKNESTVCILVKFADQFKVPYYAVNQTTMQPYVAQAEFSIPASASVDAAGSFCDSFTANHYQQIKIQFGSVKGHYHNATIRFARDNSGTPIINELALEYDLNDTTVFPYAIVNTTSIQRAVANKTFLILPKDQFLTCHTGGAISLVNSDPTLSSSVYLTEIEVQPFRNSNTSTFDGNSQPCSGDSTGTTPAPTNYATYTVYNKNGTVCMLVQFGIDVHVKYMRTDNKTYTAQIDGVNNGSVVKTQSYCNDNIAVLVIGDTWISDWSMQLEFLLKDNRFHLEVVTVNFDLATSNATVMPYDTNRHQINNYNFNKWSAAVGHSYKCKDSDDWSLNTTGLGAAIPEFHLQLQQVQVQAFMNQNASTPAFGQAEECATDYTSDIVPIAVGCALAALVVIVLIAYVIGRRRNRARGYESM